MPKIARGKKQDQKNRNQLSLFIDDNVAIINEIKALDILTMTPLDALSRISQWKEKLT